MSNIEKEADLKIEQVAKFAKEKGIESFTLLYKNGPLLSIRFEKMSTKDRMQMAISLFHQVIALELDSHPEYSKEYAGLFVSLAGEFDKLVRESNQKFIDFRKAGNKPITNKK